MTDQLTPLERARQYEKEQSIRVPERERPRFHLTPLTGWMNDPNGFCFYRGRYHLFYQYHPYSVKWGPMHWGHASSRDLLRWTYEPCAMAPDTPADAAGCFSGSAVEMPDGRLLLAYTGVQPAGTLRRESQSQCIAVGDGTNFEKYAGNPVIQLHGLDEAYSRVDFRDPKVWRNADGSYEMVAGCRHREKAGTILLFRSGDGFVWYFMGEVDSSRHELGEMWECPDFFPLGGEQVLVVSPQEMRAGGEFHAGGGTVFLTGNYDPETYRYCRRTASPADYGLNFYAPQTLLSPDGRRIMIGWMDNWETCREAPRRHPWYGQMSVPRELRLENGRVYQLPVKEIETLWKDTIRHDQVTVAGETGLAGIEGRIMDLTVTLYTAESACRRFTLSLARDESHRITICCNLVRGELVFDRSCGGSCRDIVHTRHLKTEPQDGKVTLRILMDRESIELFVNNGERAVTSLIPTPMTAEGISFSADAPLRISVEAHHLSP